MGLMTTIIVALMSYLLQNPSIDLEKIRKLDSQKEVVIAYMVKLIKEETSSEELKNIIIPYFELYSKTEEYRQIYNKFKNEYLQEHFTKLISLLIILLASFIIIDIFYSSYKAYYILFLIPIYIMLVIDIVTKKMSVIEQLKNYQNFWKATDNAYSKILMLYAGRRQRNE